MMRKLAGHFSAKKTIDAIHRSPYYWPLLGETIDEYIKKCAKCEKTKPPVKKNKAPLGGMMSTEPMERIAIDILGPLPESTKGNSIYCYCG